MFLIRSGEGQSQQWEGREPDISGKEDLDHSLEVCEADVIYHKTNSGHCGGSIFLWGCNVGQHKHNHLSWSCWRQGAYNGSWVRPAHSSCQIVSLPRLFLWCLPYMMKAMFHGPRSTMLSILLDLMARLQIWHRFLGESEPQPTLLSIWDLSSTQEAFFLHLMCLVNRV